MTKLIPVLFVLLWSTGFIGAKYGLPYSEPYTFLATRFVLTLLIAFSLLFFWKTKFPQKSLTYLHVFISGILIHAGYLGGVFSAIKLGVPAGITAVIVGLQPVLTTFVIYRFSSPLATFLSLIAFCGLVLVVLDFNSVSVFAEDITIYIPAAVALLSITFGTLYYKKYCSEVAFLTGIILQYIPTVLIFFVLSYIFEAESKIIWSWEFIFALLWLSIVLSIGAILLMGELYKRNSADTAANYFFLVPPVTLLMGYMLFDETINLYNIAGIVLIIFSIYFSKKIGNGK